MERAAAAQVEEGSDRPDGGKPEPDSPADSHQRREDDLWLREGTIRQDLTCSQKDEYRPDRHVRLELSIGQRDVERPLLSQAAAEGLRGARVLCGALQYRRGELDVLRSAARRRLPRLGRADAARFRVLDEALSEVHASADVRSEEHTSELQSLRHL